MHTRSKISGETLRRVSAELAGLPVNGEVAQRHAQALENLMASVDKLRELPLKDLTPPLVFLPEDDLT